MKETKTVLIAGKQVTYRVNPPIDPKTGKAKPTAKAKRARKAASDRMRAAWSIAKVILMNNPEMSRREVMSNLLKKNEGVSRIPSRRAKKCRGDGKIISCKNKIKNT